MKYLLIIIVLLFSCSQAPRKAVDSEQFRRELREILKQNRIEFEKEYQEEIKQLTGGLK